MTMRGDWQAVDGLSALVTATFETLHRLKPQNDAFARADDLMNSGAYVGSLHFSDEPISLNLGLLIGVKQDLRRPDC